MRSALVLGLIACLAFVGYGIHRNPLATQRLGMDLWANLQAIYVTAPASDSKDASSAPDAASASAAPAAIAVQPLSPAPHPMAVVPVTPVVAAPAGVSPAGGTPSPTPAPAAATVQPQYSVGYVAALPVAPVPQPAPLPPQSAVPRAANYPTFTDYQSGLEAARKNHVPLLILFTGSDWCQYCQMLEREVLSTSSFTKFSSSHFVFVTIDDLRNSPVLDDDKRRISGLEQKFNISGFPTMVVVNENEKELDRLEGYDPGFGPEKVIRDLTPRADR